MSKNFVSYFGNSAEKEFMLVKMKTLAIFEIKKMHKTIIKIATAVGNFFFIIRLKKGRKTNEIITAINSGRKIACSSFNTKTRNPIRKIAATKFKNLFGLLSFKLFY